MTTDAIIALVKIIKAPDQAPRIKLEALETPIDYEVPAEVTEFARKQLAGLYNWQGNAFDPCAPDVKDRLWALRLMRQLEAPKIRPRTVAPPSPSAGVFDPTYLEEREAQGRERAAAMGREPIKVESMDEIRARLRLTPAKSP
jgi:hypothetical protein